MRVGGLRHGLQDVVDVGFDSHVRETKRVHRPLLFIVEVVDIADIARTWLLGYRADHDAGHRAPAGLDDLVHALDTPGTVAERKLVECDQGILPLITKKFLRNSSTE